MLKSLMKVGLVLGLLLSSLNAKDEIFEYIKSNNIDGVKRVVKHIRNIDDPTYSYPPPLIWAAYHNRTEIMKILIESGADTEVQYNSRKGVRPLHISAIRNDVASVKLLIKKGAKVDSLNSNLETPLIYAVMNNSIKAAQILLNNGANINYYSKESFFNPNGTPLGYAAANGQKEAVEFLLKNNADVNIKKRYKPIHLAMHNNHTEIVKILEKFEKPKTTKTKVTMEKKKPKAYKYPTKSNEFIYCKDKVKATKIADDYLQYIMGDSKYLNAIKKELNNKNCVLSTKNENFWSTEKVNVKAIKGGKIWEIKTVNGKIQQKNGVLSDEIWMSSIFFAPPK